MAELHPYPLGALLTRAFRELDLHQSIFDLPLRKCFLGSTDRDLSVSLHGRRAGSPLGPAAGPQSQMAQNLVLSWLAGCRIMELKTVQENDDLHLPRPCIDIQTVGYNVEWSQELKLEQSLTEYVKGSMMIDILQASGKLPLAQTLEPVLFDMSVGYDLQGIRSPRVQEFITGMTDATTIVDSLRSQIPDEFRQYRDLDFRTNLSDTLTLSTFHGCPPQEIERIVDHLLAHNGLHCIVKLNPTLLGPEQTRDLLQGTLGYDELRIPDTAFKNDTSWDQMVEFVERLSVRATELDRGFGVKFTNTLIVENHRAFFPSSEREMYLSGEPLHVLAMRLVQLFRNHFGTRFPISFSAGIDRHNFADAVALGLVPVTVCTDLLRPGGYGRAHHYFDNLLTRMESVGAHDIGDFIIRAFGHGAAALNKLTELAPNVRAACNLALTRGDSLAAAIEDERSYLQWVDHTALLNTDDYVPRAIADPRYGAARTSKPPRKLGSELELFDCVTCSKCVPVCPNDANFIFELPPLEQPLATVVADGDRLRLQPGGVLTIKRQQQYASFADFCNHCGNCDVFCPEDGGPYVVKPRFFGTVGQWRASADLDGFAAERTPDGPRLWGRIQGTELSLERREQRERFSGQGFNLEFDPEFLESTLSGTASVPVDLGYFYIMRWIREAIYSPDAINYPSLLLELSSDAPQ